MKMKAILTAAALTLVATAPVFAADSVTLNFYHTQLPFMQSILDGFKKAHPEIVINDQAPAANYSAGDQSVIRGMMTGSAPDVYLASYSSLPTIAGIMKDRGEAQSLDAMLAKEGKDWQAANYAPAILDLAKVGGEQYAMPFTASLPLLYVNKELVEKAGGNIDQFPTTWDGVIDLAAKISKLGDGVQGIGFSVGGLSDDWYWQMMVMGAGDQMLNAKATGIGFDDKAGLEALRITQDIAVKTGMSVYADPKPAQQQFFAGKIGMVVESPSDLVAYETAIGDRFTMRTVRFPLIDAQRGGLPAGGNALMVLAKDAARRIAAWEFIKYMTSAAVQAEVSKASGYMPVNVQAAKALEGFYAQHPNFQTVFKSMNAAMPWFAYPNNTADGVWKGVAPILDQLQRGKITPDAALPKIREHVAGVMAAQ
ncbi:MULTISPECIES: ABC transporter substrate-binding protein [unclassified Rhizobium]|jgi:multiple sugar transport system substrate-binding protein|uniref:ABC transporter substrate-binding protein n=1 Tax=unclassified Rhizobium TaxID=2613769 RepID=UPI0006462826|nr:MULTISPECIES: ABC transporter substrate-binding protein [unclassified Rhizobium]OJY68349.1 MAG: ABC transporter substrate-binding protein [Rhizobium sp. 60-20]RKD45266.1 carbohydrate ABC transporter substrate-binding protein (CUT1 family) [Rhizobium sp. WW_1]